MVESQSPWRPPLCHRKLSQQGSCFQSGGLLPDVHRDSTLLDEWPCKLIAYVLMPDHTHLIVNPKDGRIKEFTGQLKSLSAKAIIKSAHDIDFKLDSEGFFHVWQESFKAVPLWSAWMIWQKINYIHANPVKAGLVSSAKDYRWSSFQAFYSGGEEPLKIDQSGGGPTILRSYQRL